MGQTNARTNPELLLLGIRNIASTRWSARGNLRPEIPPRRGNGVERGILPANAHHGGPRRSLGRDRVPDRTGIEPGIFLPVHAYVVGEMDSAERARTAGNVRIRWGAIRHGPCDAD